MEVEGVLLNDAGRELGMSFHSGPGGSSVDGSGIGSSVDTGYDGSLGGLRVFLRVPK